MCHIVEYSCSSGWCTGIKKMQVCKMVKKKKITIILCVKFVSSGLCFVDNITGKKKSSSRPTNPKEQLVPGMGAFLIHFYWQSKRAVSIHLSGWNVWKVTNKKGGGGRATRICLLILQSSKHLHYWLSFQIHTLTGSSIRGWGGESAMCCVFLSDKWLFLKLHFH